jgi:hypothetical protein
MARVRGSRRLLVLVALAVPLFVPAAGGAGASVRHGSPYAGLGTWVDIYDTAYWAHPKLAVTAMARDGARTLYLQTGNYEQPVDLVRRHSLGAFVDAAHAAGMQVVAWYLPAFVDSAQDVRRSLAAIGFRSSKGERFDSFALDIEASLAKPASLRSTRLLRLSARLRAAVGRRYPLGAIIPSPVGIRRHKTYWPGFPYRGLARTYDVFLPMAYSTSRVSGVARTRAYDSADVAIIRARTGRPHVPVHLIGGIAQYMGASETAGFMQTVGDCSPVGYSLYDFSTTSRATWRALTTAAPEPAHPCG